MIMNRRSSQTYLLQIYDNTMLLSLRFLPCSPEQTRHVPGCLFSGGSLRQCEFLLQLHKQLTMRRCTEFDVKYVTSNAV